MERMAWTDDRLQDRFDSIDRRFDEVDRRFDRVEGQIVELRRAMAGLQSTLNRVGAGIIISMGGVIVAVFLNGGA